MIVNQRKLTGKRVMLYCLGIVVVSLGIVLCKKCGMGISPISSVPLVLSFLTPLTFGELTMLFHFLNTALQMLLQRTWRNVMLWLQVPLAFVFGRVIDLLDRLLAISSSFFPVQLLILAGSIFFTALGMLLMLDGNLIQNPPDGTVKQLSLLTGKKLGTVKVCFDCVCVALSAAIGLVFLREIRSFGLATILSAIFVGKTIGWLGRLFHSYRKGN